MDTWASLLLGSREGNDGGCSISTPKDEQALVLKLSFLMASILFTLPFILLLTTKKGVKGDSNCKKLTTI